MEGREDGRYPERPRVAVGAVVFKRGRVLLVERGKPPSAGTWAIPGGSVRLGETLKQAAEREVLEETGIRIRAGEPVLAFEMIETDDTGRVSFHYVIVDLAAEHLDGEPQAASDAAAARWVSPDELPRMNVNRTTRELLAKRYGFGV
jgi:ADP-ribose pyrophosphatase